MLHVKTHQDNTDVACDLLANAEYGTVGIDRDGDTVVCVKGGVIAIDASGFVYVRADDANYLGEIDESETFTPRHDISVNITIGKE